MDIIKLLSAIGIAIGIIVGLFLFLMGIKWMSKNHPTISIWIIGIFAFSVWVLVIYFILP